MIFLLQYDPPNENLIRLDCFERTQMAEAEDARLALELELLRAGLQHEVVLLEAGSEEALRRSHLRYFANLRELVEAFGRAAA